MYPLVSICIPTYNRSAMLKDAINSALAQDYPNLEVLISDNASTDDTTNIVKEFKNPRIKYCRNDVNIGPFQNFRKAVYEHAKGKYAIILGDDDYLVNNCYITNAVKLIESNESISMVYAKCGESKHWGLNTQESFLILKGKQLLLKLSKEKRFIYLFTVLFRRNLAIVADMIPLYQTYLDISLFGKLLLHDKVGYINESVCHRRDHNGNYLKGINYYNNFKDIFYEICELGDFMKKKRFHFVDVLFIKNKYVANLINTSISQIINDRAYSEDIISLSKFAKQLFSINPFLLYFFLKPRNIAKILLSVNPSLYNFFRRYGDSYRNNKRFIASDVDSG